MTVNHVAAACAAIVLGTCSAMVVTGEGAQSNGSGADDRSTDTATRQEPGTDHGGGDDGSARASDTSTGTATAGGGGGDGGAHGTDAATATLGAEGAACIAHAGSLMDCKNCCDCLSEGVCADQRACRDTCNALGDAHFKANADAQPFTAEATLGKDGDYSECTGLETDQACKECCDCGAAFACGDHRFCRDSCAARFGPPK